MDAALRMPTPVAVATSAADLGRLAGPEALGRWALVAAGDLAPEPWAGAPRIRVGTAELDRPEPPDALVKAWHGRRRVVIELEPGVDLDAVASWTDGTLPWELPATFEPPGERLAHLVRTNSVDLRDPARPRWWLAELAVGAGAEAGGPADVTLPGGRPAWLDGGPLRRFRDDPTAASRPGDLPGEAGAGRAMLAGAVVVPRAHVERGVLEPLGAGGPTAELARDQLAAVAHETAVARIIAPAGSGKTRVLTERARHLLRDWGVHPSALCLVAYNRRAAEEIRTRTPDLTGLQVRTLNALGLAILRGTGPYRRRGDVAVVDERQVRAHLSDLVVVPRRVNTDPYQPWLDALSAVRLGLRDPAEVEDEFDGEVDGLVDVLPAYRARLAERGEVDFDEQIVGAIQVLLADPAARDAARRSCRILLVDEFQDLTPAHLLLIRLLAGPDLAVFGVGDDDQTIYGYAGATPEWLIGYDRIFPGAGDHPLTVNYRCPVPVVTAASTLLGHNRRRVPKEVHPGPAAATGDDRLAVVSAERPAAAVADHVTGTLLPAGVEPAAVAVLARVNASLAPVKVLLAERGVPAHGGVGVEWLRRSGVRAALAWLRIAAEPGRLRAADLREAARRPSRGCSNQLVDWISEKRTTDELRSLAGRLNKDRDVDRVLDLAADIDRATAVAERGTAAVLEVVRSGIGLDDALDSLDATQRAASGSHADDVDALVALAELHPDVAGFERWLSDRLATPSDPLGVTLASVHAVKGREWPHVVVHDVNEGTFPHRLAWDREEERRVFHVAITRGAETVTVLARAGAASPFLTELRTPAPPRPADRPGTGAPGPAPSATRPERAAKGSAGRRSGPGAGGPDPALLEALRAWRRARARRDDVPAYIVFNDATLADIASRRPGTLRELGRIAGIGPTKLERYGDEILGLVADAADR